MSRQAKAVIQAAVMLTVGGLVWHFFDHRIMPMILAFLAGLMLVGGFLVPPIFEGFERFGLLLAKWLGTGVTYLLLVPFYYLVFAVGRLILKLRGIDPMDRVFPQPDKTTFWEPRPAVASMDQYRKQH